MSEYSNEYRKPPTKLKVGSIHADTRYLEDPVHLLTGQGEKITIAQGTRVLRIDFMPGGKRNPPRTTEVIETHSGEKIVARVDLAEATRRMRELVADMPKFAKLLQQDRDLQTIEWVVGEANGPMARIALKRMGFIPATTTEPRSAEEYEKVRQVGKRSTTVAIPMKDFLQVEEKLYQVTQTLQKRKEEKQ